MSSALCMQVLRLRKRVRVCAQHAASFLQPLHEPWLMLLAWPGPACRPCTAHQVTVYVETMHPRASPLSDLDTQGHCALRIPRPALRRTGVQQPPHTGQHRSCRLAAAAPAVESAFEPRVCVVLGTQWGDEGKGKLVDILAQKYDVVARAQVRLYSCITKAGVVLAAGLLHIAMLQQVASPAAASSYQCHPQALLTC